jgi:hypothetical protein
MPPTNFWRSILSHTARLEMELHRAKIWEEEKSLYRSLLSRKQVDEGTIRMETTHQALSAKEGDRRQVHVIAIREITSLEINHETGLAISLDITQRIHEEEQLQVQVLVPNQMTNKMRWQRKW